MPNVELWQGKRSLEQQKNKDILRKSRPAVSLLDYDSQEVFDFLQSRLKRKNVVAAYLFGSLARNQHTAWSDIDLLVIGDFTQPFIERPREFFELFDLGIAINLLAYSPEEFAHLQAFPTGFWREVTGEMIRLL